MGNRTSPKTFAGIAIVLWLALLANPLARTNFLLQVRDPGETYPFQDDGGLYINPAQDSPPLPDAGAILERYANSREVALGLISNPSDTQVTTPDAWLNRYPRDAVIIAARLIRAAGVLQMGRMDNPDTDAAWPRPLRGAPVVPVASPASAWIRFLALAERGSQVEPQNSFFDWMKLAALFALHRDAEALRVLHAAAGKTGYNEHIRERELACLRTFQRVRPLTPSEEMTLTADILLNKQFMLMKDTALCAMGDALRARMRGRNREAVAIGADLMALSRKVREGAYLVSGLSWANTLEDVAMSEINIPPTPLYPGSHLAANPTILASPHNLAGLAWRMHKKDVAHRILMEWTISSQWGQLVDDSDMTFAYEPDDELWDHASMQARWGRILLRTFPVCLVLFAVALAATWVEAETDPAGLYSVWHGALLGIVTLGLLLAGDWAAMGRGGSVFTDTPPVYEFDQAGLIALAPVAVWGLAGGTAILLSLARARRWQRGDNFRLSWRERFEAGIKLPVPFWPQGVLALSNVVFQGFVWLGLGLVSWFFCTSYQVAPDGFDPMAPATLLCRYNGPLLIGFWSAFFLSALIRWLRLPHRPRGLRLALLNLRRLAGGYLLLVLVVYPLTILAVLPGELKFERDYVAYLTTGPAVAARLALHF